MPDKDCFNNYQYALINLMNQMPFFYTWTNQMSYGETTNPKVPVMSAIPNANASAFKLLINPVMGKLLSSKSLVTSIAKCLIEVLHQTYADDLLHQRHGGVALDLETMTRLISDGFKVPEHPEFPDEPLYITPELVARTANKLWEIIKKPKDPAILPPPSGKIANFYFNWINDNFPTPEDMKRPELTQEQLDMLKELLDMLDARADHPDPPPLTPEEKMILDHLVSEQVKAAASQSGQGPPGSIAGEIENRIKSLEHKLDWKKHLRKFRGGKGHLKPYHSFARKNKYGGTPRTMHEPGTDITFVIDDSGSMSQHEIAQGLGEAEESGKHAKTRVIFLDTGDVKTSNVIENFKRRPNREYAYKGGGGTDMRKIYDWLKENKISTDAIIFFTDGGTPFPTKVERMNIPALWVVTDKTVTVPKEAGESVYMD